MKLVWSIIRTIFAVLFAGVLFIASLLIESTPE